MKRKAILRITFYVFTQHALGGENEGEVNRSLQ